LRGGSSSPLPANHDLHHHQEEASKRVSKTEIATERKQWRRGRGDDNEGDVRGGASDVRVGRNQG